MDVIRDIRRPLRDIPENSLACDLLWSDPYEGSGFAPNDRGISHVFGADEVCPLLRPISALRILTFKRFLPFKIWPVRELTSLVFVQLEKFLDENSFDLVCRAHQVVPDGFEFFANRMLVTLFSAPNYCNEFDNAAAIMIVDQDLTCTFRVLRPRSRPSLFPRTTKALR